MTGADSRPPMPLAIWNGPYDALLPTLGTLAVGEQYEVSDRDLESAHWTPVGAPSAPSTPSTPSTPSASNQSTASLSTSSGGDS